jgi:hypothetical protein
MMDAIEKKIRERLYDFYSDKGLSGSPSPEKINSWNTQTDLAFDIIIWYAKNELTIPNALNRLDVNSIKNTMGFVTKYFIAEIAELKEYYSN